MIVDSDRERYTMFICDAHRSKHDVVLAELIPNETQCQIGGFADGHPGQCASGASVAIQATRFLIV